MRTVTTPPSSGRVLIKVSEVEIDLLFECPFQGCDSQFPMKSVTMMIAQMGGFLEHVKRHIDPLPPTHCGAEH